MKRLALLGILVASLCSLTAAKPASAVYKCPSYSRYCSTNAQCSGYCGVGVPPAWEVCYQGCCACAG